MVEEKRLLDREIRQELSKAEAYEIMDYLMVQISDRKDYHYNHFFDTPEGGLRKRKITMRERTIVKGADISYHFTLKVPTIDEGVFLEYNQRLSEREMRLLVYNNIIPEGEIKDLTSIHGGSVRNVNMTRVSRAQGMYKDLDVFFDKISHRGKNFYEIGIKIDKSKGVSGDKKINTFKELLELFGISFEKAARPSEKFV